MAKLYSYSLYTTRRSAGNWEMGHLPPCSCTAWNVWPPLATEGEEGAMLKLGSPETKICVQEGRQAEFPGTTPGGGEGSRAG